MEGAAYLTKRPPKQTAIGILRCNSFMKHFKNWMLDWIPISNSSETLRILSSALNKKLSNFREGTVYQQLECMPHETISTHLLLNFCHIVSCTRGEVKVVEDIRKRMSKLMYQLNRAHTEKLVSIEIWRGLMYLYGALKVAVMIYVEPEYSEEKIKEEINAQLSYDALSSKAKHSTRATQAMFAECCQQYSEHQSILNQIVVEDPDTLEWKLSHFLALRTARSKLPERRGKPGQREEALISKCSERDRNHPMVLLATSLYLADFAKYTWEEEAKPVVVLKRSFAGKVDLFNFIRKAVRSFLPKLEHSFYAHWSIAEMLTLDLPHHLRDNELARASLYSARDINPKSRRAKYLEVELLIDEKKFPDAVDFYRALPKQLPVREHAALASYIKLLMRDPKANKWELLDIFQKEVNQRVLGNGIVGEMMALYGIFRFMLGKEKEAVSEFSSAHAYLASEPTTTINNIETIAMRYVWDLRSLNIANSNELRRGLEDLEKRRLQGAPTGREPLSQRNVQVQRQRQNNGQQENGGPLGYKRVGLGPHVTGYSTGH